MKNPRSRARLRVRPKPRRPVRLEVDGLEASEVFYASDISESGVGFLVLRSLGELGVGQDVGLKVTLPGGAHRSFRCRGVVRRLAGVHCGIELQGLDPFQVSMLRDYIEGRLSESEQRSPRGGHRLAVATC